MILLNFSHPLTAVQIEELEKLLAIGKARIIEVPVQIDQTKIIEPQIVELTEKIGLTPLEWQTMPLLLNLPGYSPITACLLAEIEGRCGHLPSFILLRPVNGLLTTYEVSEIINLQELRNKARTRR